jgi:hypothetical protein
MKRIAYTLFFALYALTTQATEDRVELPGQMIGRWSECLDVKFIESKIGFQKNDNQEVFAFEPVTLPDSECSGGTFYTWETGSSGPGRGYCEFDKIKRTALDVYRVHANCKGQSGIEGFWTENSEFQIINGYLVVTDIPEG